MVIDSDGNSAAADVYRAMKKLEPKHVDDCPQYGPVQRPSGNFEHRRYGESGTFIHGRRTDPIGPEKRTGPKDRRVLDAYQVSTMAVRSIGPWRSQQSRGRRSGDGK